MIIRLFLAAILFGSISGMAAKRPRLPIDRPPVEELPARSYRNVQLKITSLKGFNGLQELRFRSIVANTEKVVNLSAFQEAVLAHEYNGKKYFVDTIDSNLQVFEKVTSSDWSLEYRMEKLFSGSTIGYTTKKISWIVFNSKFWYKLADEEIAANICHEYGGHKLGQYDHAQTFSISRNYSAPYGLGEICRTLYRRIIR